MPILVKKWLEDDYLIAGIKETHEGTEHAYPRVRTGTLLESIGISYLHWLLWL